MKLENALYGGLGDRLPPGVEKLVAPKRAPALDQRILNISGRLRNQRERKLTRAKDCLRRDLLAGRSSAAVRRMSRQVAAGKPLLVRY